MTSPGRPPYFDAFVFRDDGDLVVSVAGEIDVATSESFWRHLEEAIPDVEQRLVIDLRHTAFMDSAGLEVLMRAFKRLRYAGAGLVVRAPQSGPRRLLNLTRLDRIITIEG